MQPYFNSSENLKYTLWKYKCLVLPSKSEVVLLGLDITPILLDAPDEVPSLHYKYITTLFKLLLLKHPESAAGRNPNQSWKQSNM